MYSESLEAGWLLQQRQTEVYQQIIKPSNSSIGSFFCGDTLQIEH